MEGSVGNPDARDFSGMDGGLMKPKEVGRPTYNRNTLMRDLFQVLADPKFRTAADLPVDSDWKNVGSFGKLMELVEKVDEKDHSWLEKWRKTVAPEEPVHAAISDILTPEPHPEKKLFWEDRVDPKEIAGLLTKTKDKLNPPQS